MIVYLSENQHSPVDAVAIRGSSGRRNTLMLTTSKGAPFTRTDTRDEALAAAEQFAADLRATSGRRVVSVNELATLSVFVVHRRDLGIVHRFIYGGAPSQWGVRPAAPICELCGEPAELVGEQWTCPGCSPVALG